MGWASRLRSGQGVRGGHPDTVPARRPRKEDLRVSERLVDLIAPYREEGLNREDYETLIAAAAIAWNLSLLPKGERPEALRKAFRHAKVKNAQHQAEMIVELLRRKEQLFPTDDRTIVHWEVWESDNEFHVNVASVTA